MYPFVYMKNDIVLNKKNMFLFLRNLKQLNYKQDFVCFKFYVHVFLNL